MEQEGFTFQSTIYKYPVSLSFICPLISCHLLFNSDVKSAEFRYVPYSFLGVIIWYGEMKGTN